MSEDRGLPTDIEVGDAYALRTFAVKDGRLASIVQGGGHWENGVCVAICTKNTDNPDHEIPADRCHCGVYAFWTVAELVDQYPDFTRNIVAVVRLDGMTIEGDNGVKTARAQIVAWWCAEDAAPRLATVCAASSPGARRYFDRDVMVRMYGLHETLEERNHDG